MIIWAIFLSALRRRQAARAAFRELSRFDDRLLRDIDFSRGEVERFARGTPYRDFA